MLTANKTPTYPFTEAEMERAAREWGCNCGPSALAFALYVPLEMVRHAIPEFDRKRYTSPTMMKAALANLGVRYVSHKPMSPSFTHVAGKRCLVRVQWTGPWTKPGANPRWAYWATHWIATFEFLNQPLVFDCNGGIRTRASWEEDIVPLLTAKKPADGGWYSTHVWSIENAT